MFVTLMLGTQLIHLRDDPKRFAFVLILLFVFFFFLSLLAVTNTDQEVKLIGHDVSEPS